MSSSGVWARFRSWKQWSAASLVALLAAGPIATQPAETASESAARVRAEVGRLLYDLRYAEAEQRLAEWLATSPADPSEATWALVWLAGAVEVQRGPAAAAAVLDPRRWPESPEWRPVLGLFRAHHLRVAVRGLGWGPSRPAGSEEPDDPSTWSRDRLQAEADRAFLAVLEAPEGWLDRPRAALGEYVSFGTIPEALHPTCRDVVVAIWSEGLGGRYSASEAELWDLDAFLAEDPARVLAIAAADGSLSAPFRRLHLLADLELRHRVAGRVEAAFMARLERLRLVHGWTGQTAELERIRAVLAADLDAEPSTHAAWAEGMATLAFWEARVDRPDAIARARERASAVVAASPDSVPGTRARRLREWIDESAVGLEALAVEGTAGAQVRLTYRNLARVWFRLDRRDPSDPDRGQGSEPPLASWSVEVPPAADYRDHQVVVTLPFAEPGTFTLRASNSPGFHGVEASIPIQLGAWVVRTQRVDGGLEARVFRGADGAPAAGVALALEELSSGKALRELAGAETDAEGRATFSLDGVDPRASLRVAAGLDAARTVAPVGSAGPSEETDGSTAIVFTDRAVYRPGQAVRWKVVAARGNPHRATWAVLPEQALEVRLLDGSEVVAKAEATTDGFGSAEGSLEIPADRGLGRLRLATSLEGGGASVRVEEYRRPTFEVTLDPLAAGAASLRGSARYLFGAPVREGRARWILEDFPVLPWDARPRPRLRPRLTQGELDLGSDGSFEVTLPRTAEGGAPQGVGHRYELWVEVIATGGEAQTAERSYAVRYCDVGVDVEAKRSLFEAGEPVRLAVRAVAEGGRDLADGLASYRLFRLAPGAEARDRSSEELPTGPWLTAPRPETWTTIEAGHGRRRLDADGRVDLDLGRPPAGVYRLEVTAGDSVGCRGETTADFFVIAPGLEAWQPIVLLPERGGVPGETVRLLVGSSLRVPLLLESFRGRTLRDRRWLAGDGALRLIDVPLVDADQGDIHFALTAVQGFLWFHDVVSVEVPRLDSRLRLELTRFRDLVRPGAREQWEIAVAGRRGPLGDGEAQVLASMYDRSLDTFAGGDPHGPPDFAPLFPPRRPPEVSSSFAVVAEGPSPRRPMPWGPEWEVERLRPLPTPVIDVVSTMETLSEFSAVSQTYSGAGGRVGAAGAGGEGEVEVPPAQPDPIRRDFSETALWAPRLLTDRDGRVRFELTVPDSVTEWRFWAHASTRDLRFGEVARVTRSRRELQVRPQVPRFFREGDRLELPVVIDNLAGRRLAGRLELTIRDPTTGEDLGRAFGLASGSSDFRLGRARSAELRFALAVPPGHEAVVVEAAARAGDLADGERRALPVLPARHGRVESRFAAIRPGETRRLHLDGLARSGDDPTLRHERLIVTVEAGLLGSILSALPYLAEYPYECAEQVLNRFLSASVVARRLEADPRLAGLAGRLAAARRTLSEPWPAEDPNRRIALEETPWRALAAGGRPAAEAAALLDPHAVVAARESALWKLGRLQTVEGGFSWMAGGPPSPYITLYLLRGLARGLEHGIEPPRAMVARAFRYLRAAIWNAQVEEGPLEGGYLRCRLISLLTAYPSVDWTGGAFAEADREAGLDELEASWRAYPRLVRAEAALALERGQRHAAARTALLSVLDGAKTDPDLGISWQEEGEGWCWYRDSVEGHAAILRALVAIEPDDPRIAGVVQWLLLDKKLGYWRSTRTTAEVLDALVAVLSRDGESPPSETVQVRVGDRRERLDFGGDGLPGERWIAVPGDEVTPESADVEVALGEAGRLAFASATWHATSEAPSAGASEGGLFGLERRFLVRRFVDGTWVSRPLGDGERVEVGDEVEVELVVQARHPADYVHLRDPRPGGFEPAGKTSRYHHAAGMGYFEEIRDSGVNLFLERLTVGTHVLRHTLRATLAGIFRAAPATVQSMYAPEFAATSSATAIAVETARQADGRPSASSARRR